MWMTPSSRSSFLTSKQRCQCESEMSEHPFAVNRRPNRAVQLNVVGFEFREELSHINAAQPAWYHPKSEKSEQRGTFLLDKKSVPFSHTEAITHGEALSDSEGPYGWGGEGGRNPAGSPANRGTEVPLLGGS